jgi:hypothetical protein
MSENQDPAAVLHVCPRPLCGRQIERIDGTVNPRGGHLFYASPCGHQIDQRRAQEAYEVGQPPVYVQAVTGIALITAERRRQAVEEGTSAERDAQHTGGELAWAAWVYLDRAAAGWPPSEDAPEVPTMWPWAPELWKPGPTAIRMLVKAGALIAADIDRRIAAGEQP